MNSITNVSQARDFDQSQYDLLLQMADKQRVSPNQVETALLAALNNGASFSEAANQAPGQLPRVATPASSDISGISTFASGAVPSPGAMIMSLIVDMANDERKQTRELRWAQTESIVQSMEDQADKMREKAAVQLAVGIVSGALQIGMAGVQIGMAGASLGKSKESIDLHRNAKLAKQEGNALQRAEFNDASKLAAKQSDALGARAQAVGTMNQGMGGIIGSFSQFAGTMFDADLKKMDADQERMRAMRDNLKDLDDSMKELISKAIATMDSIQQNMNQTRTKILG
jgi:hypothetical protein